jgi:hypothetical protein
VTRTTLLSWVEERSAPVVATIVMLVGGMTFSLFWTSIVHGGPLRLSAPSDLWSSATSSSAILRGDFSGIYYRDASLTSPPALEFLLAPVLALGHALGLAPHLRGKGEPLSLWLVLGPAAALIGSTALFALDAIARCWRMSERSRLALALTGGLGVANVVFDWGHPEDCAALALVLWAALVLTRDGARSLPKVSWLLGLAVAFQPLALLGVIPILARFAWRAWLRSSWRLVVPSLLVLALPLLFSFRRTLFVLIRQPFQPKYISFTPLTNHAPTLGIGVLGGGPTRMISTALGAFLAFIVCRKRHDLGTVLFVMTVAFVLRLLFETELNWYYFWPVSALCLLLALRESWPRFCLCASGALGCMVLGNHRVHSIGLWWPAIMLTMMVMLVSAAPWRSDRRVGRSLHLSLAPYSSAHPPDLSD